MTSAIQENEMYLASQYCKKYISELTDLIVSETRLFNAELINCENKITNESNDIKDLKEKINLCSVYINDNKTRLQQIPNEIKDLENDIRYCALEAENTQVPVYTWECFGEQWYQVVDWDATDRNKRYIESMRERINNDSDTIKWLNSEINRCQSNINSLHEMINSIYSCIAQKENLISTLQSDIAYLQKSISSLKKEIEKAQSELNVLNTKILKGAEYIHNYGIAMAKINYKGNGLSYNAGDIFSISCLGLNQEIKLLTEHINLTSNSIANGTKGLVQFASQLQDNVSKQTQQLTIKSVVEMKKINDFYLLSVDIMKKALVFLSAYENIQI